MIFNRKIFWKRTSLSEVIKSEVMNLRFAFLVTGKYLNSALEKMAYVDDSILLVTKKGLNLALNKIAYECVKQNTACGKSIESSVCHGKRRTREIYKVAVHIQSHPT